MSCFLYRIPHECNSYVALGEELDPPLSINRKHFKALKQAGVINFTLVSQHAFGRLTESRPFHQTAGAVRCVCVCVCVHTCLCVHRRQGWVYRMPSGSGASHSALPIPVCRIRTAGSQIQITAQTKHHQK